MSSSLRFNTLIVGAGHSGAHSAIALRQQHYAGTIALIGDEPTMPYERPPLTKDYLAGARSLERLLLRPKAFWDARAITLRLDERVESVDPERRVLQTNRGCSIGYDSLIWAAGGAPRRLSGPGHDLPGVHTIRTHADVDRLTSQLHDVPRVAVIGGGYIGLEAAATLSNLGKQVTVIESLDRVLARVAGEELSRFLETEHRAHGVDIRLSTQVSALEATAGRLSGVRLADGELVPAEMVIVGIGIVPAVGPLLAAGAEGSNGVLVDECCRTSLPGIYAVGDCALHPNAFAEDRLIRLESVQNANDMAVVAANTIVGRPAAYRALPWFWSLQYDLKLQTVGLSGGHERAVWRDSRTERSFSLIYLRHGRVIALDCINAPQDYVQGRALVQRGARISPQALADASVPLKQLAESVDGAPSPLRGIGSAEIRP